MSVSRCFGCSTAVGLHGSSFYATLSCTVPTSSLPALELMTKRLLALPQACEQRWCTEQDSSREASKVLHSSVVKLAHLGHPLPV